MKQYQTKKIFLVQDIICIMIIIGMIGYTLYAITQMPQKIPIHLTNGVVYGMGSKWISLLLTGIIVFIYIVFIFFICHQMKLTQSIISLHWLKLGCIILSSL